MGWFRNTSRSISEAIKENLPGILLALLVLVFLLLWLSQRIFITIKSGEGGVLYKRFGGGTVVEHVYEEGFHIIMPWDIMTKYNLRVQTIAHDFDVLTKEGLKIKIKLAVRYHPERNVLAVMHKYVGEDYVNKIVIPEIEATVRSFIAEGDVRHSYQSLTNKTSFQEVVDEAIERASRKYVTIDDVMITRIDLPDPIELAIMQKLEQQQLALGYKYRLEKEEKEAERKRIEAEGIKHYNQIVNSSLSEGVLVWKGIEATRELATSENSKVVMIGPDKQSLPVILNAESPYAKQESTTQEQLQSMPGNTDWPEPPATPPVDEQIQAQESEAAVKTNNTAKAK